MSSYSKLTGYKKIKGRIFLKAHFSKKRGYKNVESNSRAVTLNLPQFLPGASASHTASQVTSLMDFLSQEITSAATSDDRVSWSASMIWDLWNFIHRMLAGSAGGDLDETCSISTGFCFGKPLRHLEALNQRCLIPKCPKAPRWDCRSLTLRGYKGQVAGVSIRPNMPYAQQTSEFVHKYIKSLRKGAALDKPLTKPNVPVIFSFPNLHGDTPKRRANAAACIRAKLARERAQNA